MTAAAKPAEAFFSMDGETAGSIPGIHSLLTLGSCLAEDDSIAFEAMLKPISWEFEPGALAKNGLTLERCNDEGEEPAVVIPRWREWVLDTSAGGKPVFVGVAAAYDFAFVNYYFHRYCGPESNPFGFAPLDLKALFMGLTGCSWKQATTSHMDNLMLPSLQPNHKAMAHARYQAELFRLIRARLPRQV